MSRMLGFAVALAFGLTACGTGEARERTKQKPAELLAPAVAAKPVVANRVTAGALALPGTCTDLLGHAEVVREYDFDGDGIKDALVEVASAHCDKYECPMTVYVQRGPCGHAVGRVSVGFGSTLMPQPTRSHGLANLIVSGLAGTVAYEFDGTRYIARVVEAESIDRPRE